MTRPLARPMIGMCQSEVARSSSPSIRRAFLLGTRGSDPSGDAVGQGGPSRRWARLHDLAGERTTDDLLDAPAGGEEAIEVDAGCHAHRVQAVDEILGADVARGAGRERASTETADGGVEVRDAALHGRQDVGD